jgi:drug/metabolite transporter (DMT)-like permease
VPLLLATLSSVIFGVGDFTGAMAARRSPAVTVVVGAHVTGLLGLAVAAPFFGDGFAPVQDLGWGIAAGLGGSIGVAVLYHALARTPMSVTASVAALVGTAAPVLFGVAIGERPAPLAWVGMAVALPALLLIPGGRRDASGRRSLAGLGYGTAVGLFFGVFGICISRTGSASGVWPLFSARSASVVLMSLVVLISRRPLVAPRAAVPWVVATGVLDSAANVLFLLAVRVELLSLVAVITSLYPASTVALARVVLGERVGRIQALGMVLAVAAVSLIAMA